MNHAFSKLFSEEPGLRKKIQHRCWGAYSFEMKNYLICFSHHESVRYIDLRRVVYRDSLKFHPFWTCSTLPETNVAPENRSSQKGTSSPTIHFQVQTVSFREGIIVIVFSYQPPSWRPCCPHAQGTEDIALPGEAKWKEPLTWHQYIRNDVLDFIWMFMLMMYENLVDSWWCDMELIWSFIFSHRLTFLLSLRDDVPSLRVEGNIEAHCLWLAQQLPQRQGGLQMDHFL